MCYQYQPRPDIESREESVAFWYRAANREELLGNRATALTYRNMGWLLEHPEGWTQFIGKEKVEAGLDQLLNVD